MGFTLAENRKLVCALGGAEVNIKVKGSFVPASLRGEFLLAIVPKEKDFCP